MSAISDQADALAVQTGFTFSNATTLFSETDTKAASDDQALFEAGAYSTGGRNFGGLNFNWRRVRNRTNYHPPQADPIIRLWWAAKDSDVAEMLGLPNVVYSGTDPQDYFTTGVTVDMSLFEVQMEFIVQPGINALLTLTDAASATYLSNGYAALGDNPPLHKRREVRDGNPYDRNKVLQVIRNQIANDGGGRIVLGTQAGGIGLSDYFQDL